MHDLTPLASMMHLKELDRQAAPKLIPLKLGQPRARGIVTLAAFLRRLLAIGVARRLPRLGWSN